MADQPVTPQNVTNIIDYIKKTKDPAVIGLRRILKNKEDSAEKFPLKIHELGELGSSNTTKNMVFDQNEQRIMEMEKQVIHLNEKLKNQAKNSETAIQKAYSLGLQKGTIQGEKNGFEKAKIEYDQTLETIEQRVQSILIHIEQSRIDLIHKTHRELLDLAILMARKIIDTEIQLNKSHILSVIKKALSYIANRQNLTIHISPDDFDLVKDRKEMWTSIADNLDTISLQKDARILKGGCIIESEAGIADARIDIQMNEIIDHINTAWDNIEDFSDEPANQDSSSKSPVQEPEHLEPVACVNEEHR